MNCDSSFSTNILETLYRYERVNAKYMRPALVRNRKRQEFDASRIVRNYSKAAVSNAIAEMKFTDLKKVL